ncbi:MAG: GNAT family N-acetyltransferase [Deltaproteobacteria bacterium]|nr:GNAT family N-acetyltransferase [Deltaproteobacteria bacterium]
MRVRSALIGDFAALNQLLLESDFLHAELLPRLFRKPKGISRPCHEIERILRSSDDALLVAEDAGPARVVGLVHVQIYHTPPSTSMVQARRAHVDSLVVAREFRRHGVGRALVEAASGWAGRRGAVEVLLTVWAGNREAEAFYRELGFDHVSQVLGKRLD